MILLTCTKMPVGLDKNTLAYTVGLLFPHPDNREYIETIRSRANPQSACESLFALALLYEQICELPCPPVNMSALIFARNEFGKPYFKDSDLRFNVSHSNGLVACALSQGEELGLDLEASEIPPARAKKLAARYFNEAEQQSVANHPEIFARLWSEKEAKAKFFGTSIGNILSDDKITGSHPRCPAVYFHRFSYQNIPITLCTISAYSTISFTFQ